MNRFEEGNIKGGREQGLMGARLKLLQTKKTSERSSLSERIERPTSRRLKERAMFDIYAVKMD